MTCLSPDLMDRTLEGELDERDRREVEAHLRRCPACRTMLDERRVLLEAFRSLPAVLIPPGFAERVMESLPAPGRLAFGWVAAFFTGVCASLAALLGYYLLTGESAADILISVNRSFLSAAGLVLPFLARAARLAAVFARLARGVAVALLKGLDILSSVIRPEVLGLLLVAGIILSFLLVFGVRRILSVGEKS